MQAQAHGFGVDGDTGLEGDVGGQIAAMKMVGHGVTLLIQTTFGGSFVQTDKRPLAGSQKKWCPREDSNLHDLAVTGT